MATLEYNRPVVTRTPAFEIDGLKAGTYRFQLRVIDDAGNVSRPDIVSVQVTASRIIPLEPGLNPIRDTRDLRTANFIK